MQASNLNETGAIARITNTDARTVTYILHSVDLFFPVTYNMITALQYIERRCKTMLAIMWLAMFIFLGFSTLHALVLIAAWIDSVRKEKKKQRQNKEWPNL